MAAVALALELAPPPETEQQRLRREREEEFEQRQAAHARHVQDIARLQRLKWQNEERMLELQTLLARPEPTIECLD